MQNYADQFSFHICYWKKKNKALSKLPRQQQPIPHTLLSGGRMPVEGGRQLHCHSIDKVNHSLGPWKTAPDCARWPNNTAGRESTTHTDRSEHP